MYDAGHCHYYVNEVLRLKNGLFVIPIRWVMSEDKVHADIFSISFNDKARLSSYPGFQKSLTISQREAMVLDNETSLVCSDQFQDNYFDLEHAGKILGRFVLDLSDQIQFIYWVVEPSIKAGHSTRMPNPKRIIAGGDPLYCSFVDYYGNDVSGNRTKSWNKHWNVYMTHRNLPRQILQQEFHVHFISTSPNASITEQYGEFKLRVEYLYFIYYSFTTV
jgi:hypothetical protein